RLCFDTCESHADQSPGGVGSTHGVLENWYRRRDSGRSILAEERPMIHRRHSPPRRGIMVAWLALALVAILSMVALAMDGGRMMTERQNVQATADAAALAAAGILYQEYPSNGGYDALGNARAAALQMAAANGITNGNNAVVTVNIGPTQGDFIGKPGYAEVI